MSDTVWNCCRVARSMRRDWRSQPRFRSLDTVGARQQARRTSSMSGGATVHWRRFQPSQASIPCRPGQRPRDRCVDVAPLRAHRAAGRHDWMGVAVSGVTPASSALPVRGQQPLSADRTGLSWTAKPLVTRATSACGGRATLAPRSATRGARRPVDRRHGRPGRSVGRASTNVVRDVDPDGEVIVGLRGSGSVLLDSAAPAVSATLGSNSIMWGPAGPVVVCFSTLSKLTHGAAVGVERCRGRLTRSDLEQPDPVVAVAWFAEVGVVVPRREQRVGDVQAAVVPAEAQHVGVRHRRRWTGASG